LGDEPYFTPIYVLWKIYYQAVLKFVKSAVYFNKKNEIAASLWTRYDSLFCEIITPLSFLQ